MPSYSRNSRKPLRALHLALAVEAAALLSGSVAHAAEQASKFVMTAYTNGAGGKSLVMGDFEDAVTQVQRRAPSLAADAATLDTNKCVAYTMTAQFEAAESLCNAAVISAQRDLNTATSSMLWERPQLAEYLAVAYSNRAVLHWLSSDAVAAARDLAEAVALSPKSDFVRRNIVALRSPHETAPHDNAVAQATVTPKS